MTNFPDTFSKKNIFTAFVGAIILFSIPAISFASEAAFQKYYRAGASSVGNPGCPPGWTQVDSWSIDEGDSADGGGGTHTGFACVSSVYKAAFAKYYRTNSSNSFPPCPSGWTSVDTWAVQEGDKGDGGGGWHSGVVCASNSYQSAISKYYRERAGSRPQNAWALNVDQCPQGSWTKIDSWSVYEGDSADGGGGQHDGFACAYTGSDLTKTYTKYYRTNRPPDDYPATIPSCAAGWNRTDTWGVWEGDSADGGGNWHTGVVCAATNPVGTIVAKATLDGKDWPNPPSFTEVYDAPYGANQTATLTLPQTFTDMQAGIYTVKSITPPAGVTLKDINGSPLPYSATLSVGGTITVTYNFVTIPPATGTLILKATKDGQPWDAPAFTVSGSSPLGPTFVLDFTADTEPVAGTQTVPNAPVGVYTIDKLIPPAVTPSVTLQNINGSPMPPSYSQTLSANGTITIAFNFKAATVPVPTFVVSPTSASVQVGGPQQFYAIYDPDGSGPLPPQYVTNSSLWSSSNNSVATINSIGSAVGASAGSASITAQYSGLTASASLTVTAPTPTLTVTPSSWSLAVGDSKQFTATYDPDGSGPQPSQDVTATAAWSPSDASKVTVSGGLATRVGNGYTSITASYSGLSRSATILDPATLRVSPPSATLNSGDTVQLSAMYDPDGASGSQTEQDVTTSANWSSSRPSVASVDNGSSKGSVSAVASGPTARITALYNGLSAQSNIHVSAPPPPPLVVSCSATPPSTMTGKPVVWKATASGGTGSYGYSWSGSNPIGGRTGNPVTVSYSTNGTKTGSVVVTSGSQTSPSTACTNSVEIKNPLPLSVPTLTATPSGINKGDSSTLTWTSTNNAARCDSNFSTDSSPNNTSPGVQVSPVVDTTYSIYCTNADGVVGPAASATVTVIPVTVSIKASPTCINGGGNSKISWSATPSNLRCNVSGPGLSRLGLTGAPLTGFQNVSVSAKSTYTIACTTNGGSPVPPKSVVVDVSGCWSEF